MNIPLFALKIKLGVKATHKQMESINKNINSIIDTLEAEDDTFNEVPGKTRVFAETNSSGYIKDWELSIVSPAILEHHPLRFRLEGLAVTLFHTKQVYSRKVTFNQVNKK